MSQAGSIRQRDGYWILRYRVTRPELRCKVCGQLPTRHSRAGHSFDGETKLVRVQLLKKLGKVEDCDKRLKKIAPAYIREEAARVIGPVTKSTIPPERNITVGEFVETVYFPHLEAEGMKPSTIAGYRARWNSQLKSRIANKRLREFDSTEADELFRDIARSNPGMTRSTLRHFKSLLSGAYRLAIVRKYVSGFVDENQKIHGNPMRESSIPHSAPEGNGTYVYSADDVVSMIGLLPEPAKTAVAIAGFTGLRCCEIFALRWEDLQGSELKVERAVWNGKVGTLKTQASRAPVPVIEPLQRRLAEYRWKCGDPQEGFMFPTSNRTPIDQTNLVDRIILPTLNVCLYCGKNEEDHLISNKDGHEYERDPRRPKWRAWHAFRRGLATTLHASGEADKTIQAILRHANVNTTQQCYIKAVPENSTRAMLKFGALIADKMLTEFATA